MEIASIVTDFIHLGMTDNPQFRVLIFGVFLIVYIITVLRNLGLVVLIRVSPCLHLPMYFSSLICPFLMSTPLPSQSQKL